MSEFVRFQSAVPNRNGRYPGVFALANGLASNGLLSVADQRAWRHANDHMNAEYAPPTDSDPTSYDPQLYPGAVAWFKVEGAQHLLTATRFYLDMLTAYNCPWLEVRTHNPGRVHFEDEVQVVATPWTYPDDWPFT